MGFITAIEHGQDVNSYKKELGNPIIIVPGVMGSRLFASSTVFDETTRVWEPATEFKETPRLLELKRQFKEGVLFVRPFEKQNYGIKETPAKTVRKYGKEYGAQDTYKQLVDDLVRKLKTDRDVYIFSYDWRDSNTKSAENLYIAICSLEKKVDLVCHSMGGLVVSKYYQMYKHHQQFDKIITCATPYEGAPKLINSIMNWDVLGEGTAIVGEGSGNNWIDLALGILGVTSEVKASFRGVGELTPTKNYVSKCPMQVVEYKVNENQDDVYKVGKNLTYEEYIKKCNAIFNQNNTEVDAYNEIRKFQASILGASGYNVLLEYENAFFAIGVNKKTIKSIRFDSYDSDIDQRLYESDLEYDTLGDGTVPYLSSSILEQIPYKDPNKKRWVTFTADHIGIVKNEVRILGWAADILDNDHSDERGDDIILQDYIVIRVACPVDITITHGGEALTSKDGKSLAESSYGRLDFIGKNKEIKMVCMDDADDYEIVLNGTGSGSMDYSIRFFNKNGVLCETHEFTNLQISDKTVIYTGTNRNSCITLSMDTDGDGIIDEIHTASDDEKEKKLTWFTDGEDEESQMKNESGTKYVERKGSFPTVIIGKDIGKWNYEKQNKNLSHTDAVDRHVLLQRLVTAFVQRKTNIEKEIKE